MLALFSLLLILPALTVDGDSALPACCRKGGQHHCSMANMEEQSGETSGFALKSSSTKCPLFSQGGAVPAYGNYIVRAAVRFFAAIVSHPTAHAQIEAQYRVSFSRAWQKRGPPALLV
jgi:hypothetical protein